MTIAYYSLSCANYSNMNEHAGLSVQESLSDHSGTAPKVPEIDSNDVAFS